MWPRGRRDRRESQTQAKGNEMAVRKSSAVWEGELPKGKGRMSLGSGAFEGQYSFASRFEEGTGTNPEELIGAAHAGCFSMALAGQLGQAGHPPRRISTEARVHLEKRDEGFTITRIELNTRGEVPGIDRATFLEHAERAKQGCPVSRALKAVQIDLKAELLEG
jgi:lipoyl-dependent peroxiredoxin